MKPVSAILSSAAAAAALLLGAVTVAQAAGPQGRVIVAFKPDAAILRAETRATLAQTEANRSVRLQRRADALSALAGLPLATGRAITPRWQVVRADGLDSDALAQRIAAHPDVAWAQPDRRRRAFAVPNDPLYPRSARPFGPTAGQWYLQPPDAEIPSATNAQAAWDLRPAAGEGVVIAVIDTGVRPEHPDLAGRLLPGIDTIDELSTSNDGDGPDADASDPGDWVTAAEGRSGPLAGCDESPSSWHGTQVSTIAGARTNDNNGMAGTAYGARILPVRVLGKCGGYDSDIVAGMLWAAGLETVAGIVNANPARVLNMSLGGGGSCEPAYVEAVQRINAAGAVVIAAAGNTAGRAVGSPANCPGVIAVAGLRHVGAKVGFSDLGPQIAISAPGGNCVFDDPGEPCRFPILAGIDRGTQGPISATWSDSTDYSVGTSFAAPIVSGTAAIVLAGRPALAPDELRRALQAGARPFPQDGASNEPISSDPVPACVAPGNVDQFQCYCSTALCGAGMLDAPGAVLASEAAFARIDLLTAAPTAGSAVSLDGGSSLPAVGRSVQSYTWSVVNGGGIVNGFSSATDAAVATVSPTAAGSFTVQLQLTDDQGNTSVQQLLVNVAAATGTPTPPTSGGGGSSGGGAMGGAWLLMLMLAGAGLKLNRRV
jgi:serine protease